MEIRAIPLKGMGGGLKGHQNTIRWTKRIVISRRKYENNIVSLKELKYLARVCVWLGGGD